MDDRPLFILETVAFVTPLFTRWYAPLVVGKSLLFASPAR